MQGGGHTSLPAAANPSLLLSPVIEAVTDAVQVPAVPFSGFTARGQVIHHL